MQDFPRKGNYANYPLLVRSIPQPCSGIICVSFVSSTSCTSLCWTFWFLCGHFGHGVYDPGYEFFGPGGYGSGYEPFGLSGPYLYVPCYGHDPYTYGLGGGLYIVFQQLSTVFFDCKYLFIHISLEPPSNMMFNTFVSGLLSSTADDFSFNSFT